MAVLLAQAAIVLRNMGVCLISLNQFSEALGDSAVTLMDLCQLKLSAELVALSGCGTGLNVVVGGDELLGLTRGLLQANAHSTLVTLWDVHDASTTEFMDMF